MTEAQNQIINIIRKAYYGVILEDGIGLKEAQGLDDNKDELSCAKYRALDEKKDWAKISTTDLVKHHSSLNFFDAKGLRFHLPAFLIAAIEGTMTFETICHLTNISDLNFYKSRYSILNKSQKKAVEVFLWDILNNEKFKNLSESVLFVIENY